MKANILIVEDEALIALSIERRLRNLGHQVCGMTASGEEALTLAGTLRPDLILMDINLGGAMDGIQAAGLIREIYDIPVVYLTAHAGDHILERAKTTHPYGFLLKPFQETDLRIGLDMALHHRATEQRARESEEMFRLVTESIEDIFWLSSCDLNTLYYVSPSYERLWGRSLESLQQDPRSFLNSVHDEDRDRVFAAFSQLLQESHELEYRLLRPDGSVRWVRDRRFPVCDPDGCCLRMAGIVTDITEQRQAQEELLALNEQLKEQATHDMLTGLPNRRLFIDRLEQALAHARRFGGRVGMLFIDLDGFKGINDQFGHQAGDEVLILIAGRISLLLRQVDSAARLGGDEFGIVLPEILHLGDAELVGQKVLLEISQEFSLRDSRCYLGASVGIAVFPDHGATADELISRADKAMYLVKESGKRGVGVCQPPDVVKGV